MDNTDLEPLKPLILRSNRFLGAALQEAGLITVEQLEAANQQFLDQIQGGDICGANLLYNLIGGEPPVDEATLIDHALDRFDVGVIDLALLDLSRRPEAAVDFASCWATQTVLFDSVDGIHFLASTYYFSKPVIKHWEKMLGGTLLWYVTSCVAMASALERFENVLASA